jgi:hypothetical protein
VLREIAMRSCLEVPLQRGERRALDLLEEIALLEERRRLMGEDGDCAYERAISRLYQSMVAERWQLLAVLEGKSA